MTIFFASLIVFLLCMAGMMANRWLGQKRNRRDCTMSGHCEKACSHQNQSATEDQVQ